MQTINYSHKLSAAEASVASCR